MSRVVPGTGETIAAGRPASTFSNELFPAFGGPTSVPDIQLHICVYTCIHIYIQHTDTDTDRHRHTHTHTHTHTQNKDTSTKEAGAFVR